MTSGSLLKIQISQKSKKTKNCRCFLQPSIIAADRKEMKMLQEEENMEQLAIFGGKPVREKKIFYGRQYIDQADVEVITSWKDGKLIFRDTPFKEVLKMLSKRFDVDFVVKNPKCFEASFTGVLEKQRLGRILEYISVSSNIKFKYAESNNIHQEKQKIEVY